MTSPTLPSPPSRRWLPLLVLAFVGGCSTWAFVVPTTVPDVSSSSRLAVTPLHWSFKNTQQHHQQQQVDNGGAPLQELARQWKQTVVNGLVAATIAATAAGLPLTLNPSPAMAATDPNVLQLSKGAVVVQTTSENLVKSTIDSKSLLKTLFLNRQELTSSLGRIQAAIAQELSQPVWNEISKEILSVEGDLVNLVKISPPSDVKETIRDIASGKLNLLVNGEVVNVAVVPNFGEQEDDLVIAIKGFKGNKVFSFANDEAPPRYGPIRSYFSKYEGFWTWWSTPFPSKVSHRRVSE